jgi:hypothetical protein
MAARKQHFLAEHRRLYPSNNVLDPPAPEPLARSTIRSPAHAAAAAGVAARIRAGAANPAATSNNASTSIYGAPPTMGREGDHPRHAGRNGTPKPNIIQLQPLAPLLPLISSDDPTSPASSPDSAAREPRSRPQPRLSSSGSESSEGHGDAQQRGRERERRRRIDNKLGREATATTLLGKCAEPTFSIGLPRRTA